MFPKALWMKEWKHSKVVSFGLFVVFMLGYPISAGLNIDSWRMMKEQRGGFWEEQAYYAINEQFSPGFYGYIAVGVMILLVGFLIGLEKNTKRHDFMMALPFSRTQIFATKYAFGLIVMSLSYSLSFTLGYLVIYQSEFRDLIDLVNITDAFFIPLAGYFVIYSFLMLIGAIAGEIKSQILLSIIFLFFLQGFLVLLSMFSEIHGLNLQIFELDFIFEDLFWFSYLNIMTDSNIVIPLLFGIIFTALAWFCYQRSPSEHSGEFLMFRQLHPLFAVGIPICSALLGGLIVISVIPYNSGEGLKIMVYWIGFLVAMFFSWKVTKRLLRM
ncbi:ABC transporter permease [Tenuibacillus multivorans]|uniref:ABC-2 type transport system permease protein n=1 Tax=Tenuibacillus multivorans TaxID=237069 RepID=A0A1H0G5E9_9BACI|nr:ABC transporter permease [Tenuibacillus multivorans]GEL78809.1 hypothetical protein TMU01_30440 [Tenuibacillus multivorans]SDO02071.1 ABC-2 type transport system permease protein [Tenuibacillus multivorans]